MSASLARLGLDLLLARFPEHEVQRVVYNHGAAPWVQVDLRSLTGRCSQFAVWRETGAVYRCGLLGDVEDDPFLVPEGSAYDGPVAA